MILKVLMFTSEGWFMIKLFFSVFLVFICFSPVASGPFLGLEVFTTQASQESNSAEWKKRLNELQSTPGSTHSVVTEAYQFMRRLEPVSKSASQNDLQEKEGWFGRWSGSRNKPEDYPISTPPEISSDFTTTAFWTPDWSTESPDREYPNSWSAPSTEQSTTTTIKRSTTRERKTKSITSKKVSHVTSTAWKKWTWATKNPGLTTTQDDSDYLYHPPKKTKNRHAYRRDRNADIDWTDEYLGLEAVHKRFTPKRFWWMSVTKEGEGGSANKTSTTTAADDKDKGCTCPDNPSHPNNHGPNGNGCPHCDCRRPRYPSHGRDCPCQRRQPSWGSGCQHCNCGGGRHQHEHRHTPFRECTCRPKNATTPKVTTTTTTATPFKRCTCPKRQTTKQCTCWTPPPRHHHCPHCDCQRG